ncbi:MAG: type II toxin-antitoxin system PemK/MazF family toxin [Deltaproteobacteria bacterium]|nr:type II toxin-antitoxin system PemK/MazF family toxin [Deltaproteobacteria bacterium]
MAVVAAKSARRGVAVHGISAPATTARRVGRDRGLRPPPGSSRTGVRCGPGLRARSRSRPPDEPTGRRRERVQRGDVFLVDLDPTRGSEIEKMRPCVVVSPDQLNAHLRTVIVAPLTTGGRPYPFRVPCRFLNRNGHVVTDQLRTVDRERLLRHLGRLSGPTFARVATVLQEMFAP